LYKIKLLLLLLLLLLWVKGDYPPCRFGRVEDRLSPDRTVKNGIARAFVAIADYNPNHIKSYYTLSSFEEIPALYKKCIPRYPVPAIRIGHLAVGQHE
jgi:hypothetical protein